MSDETEAEGGAEESGDDPPVNWAQVTLLRHEIGAEDFAEVVSLFMTEVEEILGSLPRVEAADLPGVLHFLKGAAMNLGFARLARLCVEGEQRAAERAVPDPTSRQGTDPVDRDAVVESYYTARTEFLREVEIRYAA